jgi:hypothetical protein
MIVKCFLVLIKITCMLVVLSPANLLKTERVLQLYPVIVDIMNVRSTNLVSEQHIYLSCSLYNRQTSGESASFPQYLGCNTVFDMRLRVTFLRRKTVTLQLNIAHRE